MARESFESNSLGDKSRACPPSLFDGRQLVGLADNGVVVAANGFSGDDLDPNKWPVWMTYLVHEMGLEYEFKVLSSKSTAEGIALHGAARMALRIDPIGATCPPGTWRCRAWFWERICIFRGCLLSWTGTAPNRQMNL